MPQIINKYEGNKVAYPYTWGTAYYNYVVTSLPKKTTSGVPAARVEFIVSTYRIEGGDQHQSLFSTNEDKHVSSFQGNRIAYFSIVTSTKTGYLDTLIDGYTDVQLQAIFQRPGVVISQREVGTSDLSEIAPYLAEMQLAAIPADTLSDP